MSFQERGIPQSVQEARKRIEGMRAIDPALDLGNGLTLKAFEKLVQSYLDGVDAHNGAIAALKKTQNQLNKRLKEISSFSGRMLNGVGSRFGEDSDEYEQAGGTRTSERKHRSNGSDEEPSSEASASE